MNYELEKVKILRSGFEGHAEDILSIRNRNRIEKKSLDYIIWRYKGQKPTNNTDIFWVYYNEKKVGMAALIHRPYYLNGEEKQLLILGDISLDRDYRGSGMVDKLFKVIDEYYSDTNHIGFVFPNSAAKRVLAAHGWSYLEPLIHNVLLLNPYEKIRSVIKNRGISKACSKAVIAFLHFRLKFINTVDYRMEHIIDFTNIFDDLFNDFDKSGLLIANKFSDNLKWRYSQTHFGPRKIVIFRKQEELIGFCVYKYSFDETVCSIYEFLCLEKKDIKYCLKLLIQKMIEQKMTSIRMMCNHAHPYAGILRSIGFIGRNEGGGLYGYNLLDHNSKTKKNSMTYMLSTADKDV